MPLNLENKKRIVREINEMANASVSMVIADYRGLTAPEMTSLRAQAREADVCLRVVPNTLTRRALEGTDFACFNEAGLFIGPIILAFSREDLGAAARVMRAFLKEHEILEIKGLALDGKLLQPAELDAVASLPSRKEALASLLSVMKAPVTKLARTLNEVPSKLVRTVAAVSEKRKNNN